MLVRLTLVCSGVSAAVQRGAFPRDEPADMPSLARASGLAGLLGKVDRALIAPAFAARRTAEVLSLQPDELEDLRDLDYGAWAGRSFAEVGAAEPEALAAWLHDPEAAPPKGESFADLSLRVARMLDRMVGEPGHTVAVTHASVIRAAILHVIGAPQAGGRHIDVEPLSLTDLRSDGRRWTLRATGITARPPESATERGVSG
ncbi:histidine phosphatase family protein [Mesorhizobium sp. SP-1A]|uniref:histidine phosphatase family protein n=1 Tax=Mesorhizobium sp. SP-1A TaxID=3077840 RepID=UPI0028F73126|nr:histidine phosphatase family protein [Mesorhizobium sp. SP-1A]